MKNFTCVNLFALLLTLSCQDAGKTAEEAKPALSLQDSLYRDVLRMHEEVMPKMGRLQGYQNELQFRVDSLNSKLSLSKNAADRRLKLRYQQLKEQLAAAEKGMNDWMDSFKPDPKFASTAEAEAFWKAEFAKTKKMRNDILEALDSASAHLE